MKRTILISLFLSLCTTVLFAQSKVCTHGLCQILLHGGHSRKAVLTAGGVFPEILLQNFIKAKRAECAELSKIPHPAEFEKYYNL